MEYFCSECNLMNRISENQAVVCKFCGARILYKIRTKKILEYEAR